MVGMRTVARLRCSGSVAAGAALVVLATALAPDEGGAGRAASTDLPPLVHLEPGAEVGAGPPAGWTHRVIRSVPRLGSGDLSSLPGSARTTATLLRTVIAAEVVGRDGSFRLARIGVGNAVPVGDREFVTTSDGPEAVLDTLGVIERLVLRTADARLDEGSLIARTPTFALFRTPSVLLVNGRHEDVDLHYALLVDPDSGRLTALAWAVAAGSHAAPDEVAVLPPNLSWDLPLDVRVNRHVGPIPVAWSFAMPSLPPGRHRAVTEKVARAISGVARGATDPAILERSLRALSRHVPAR